MEIKFFFQVLNLTPLEVKEGEKVLISSQHLKLVLDYEKVLIFSLNFVVLLDAFCLSNRVNISVI